MYVLFRYEDFFGGKKKKPSKKSKLISNSENSDADDEDEGEKTFENQVMIMCLVF